MGSVLVACEFSGVVRDAFVRAGHDAMSCDLLPAETERPDRRGPGHWHGDIRDMLAHEDYRYMGRPNFDLVIAHPPCTFLCNSGVRWLHTKPGRWGGMLDAAEFFRLLWSLDVPRIAVENPVMHGHARGVIGCGPPTQTIQPWQFGHGEIKRTCLWLKGLPPLTPTNIVAGREARVHRMSPGPNRGKERSRTLQGIADAMAEQWGALLP